MPASNQIKRIPASGDHDDYWLRLWNLAILAGLLLSFPLTFVLPQSVGWENGLLENIQAVTLLLGMGAALVAARSQKGAIAAPLWWIAALFWLAFLGRELAWGAAFLPSIGAGKWGPVISSQVLWYRPAVKWVVGGMLLLCCYWFVRHDLWNRVFKRMVRERAIPVFSLVLFIVAMVISTNAEGHGFIFLQHWFDFQVIVLEELVETFGYFALWLAQWALVRHVSGWQEEV
ncbi:Uncharacterised protein [Delftia tsuruhatensis]|nr:Uncharacterised protein [Delftia tsuruhatensis]CAC9693644.1 Uncharacterised protein [Delftia tsuruhatensis]